MPSSSRPEEASSATHCSFVIERVAEQLGDHPLLLPHSRDLLVDLGQMAFEDRGRRLAVAAGMISSGSPASRYVMIRPWRWTSRSE